jgi:hypothetical protein
MHQIDFKNKTIEETLDMLLKRVRIKDLHFPISSADNLTQYLTLERYHTCLEKLRKDEFIAPDRTEPHKWAITVEGLLFEGYVQQKIDITRKRKVESLNIMAVTLGGIGAAISGLYLLGLAFYKLVCLYYGY